MAPHIIAGAYAAAPPDAATDTFTEQSWYQLLRAQALIGGLELPWTGTLHGSGIRHLASLLHPTWRSVVTAIPGTAQRMAENPLYGLASDDPTSRSAAVSDIRTLFKEVQVLREILGPDAVTAVELQSAPTRPQASSTPESLARSLLEIAAWDWDGVALAVEHCDAGLPANQTQKGFMSLTEEIAAVETARGSTGAQIGLTVNWGRSAIETQGPEGPVEHIQTITGASQLFGIIFSGAAPRPTAYGAAFADVHVPLGGTGLGCSPDSLMTRDAIHTCLKAGNAHLLYLGVKVAALPKAQTLQERLLTVTSALKAIPTIV